MGYSLQVCDCIYLERPSRYSVPHPWFIITEPFGDPSEILMVNATTRRDGTDGTVVLTPDDHPSIQHPSVIYYADARATEVELLERLVALDGSRLHPTSCRPEVIERIQCGLLESEFTPRKIKKLWTEIQNLRAVASD